MQIDGLASRAGLQRMIACREWTPLTYSFSNYPISHQRSILNVINICEYKGRHAGLDPASSKKKQVNTGFRLSPE